MGVTTGDPSGSPRPLHTYSLGFLRQRQVRRILELAGWRVRFGWPAAGATVGVWGQRPVSWRGRWVARRTGASLLTVEDGFLRSVRPGVTGEPPLSLVLDDVGIYYDAARPSRLEQLLYNVELDVAGETRASASRQGLLDARLSKYTPPVPPDHAFEEDLPDQFVLVVDQTSGDASIPGAGADASTFRKMLDAARSENPGASLVIKSHPDVLAGSKRGHFNADDLNPGERLIADEVNPWDLIDRASVVYTVSSQIGYEAILAGRKVRCFGHAFYAGWGLTDDEAAPPRRGRRLTVDQLFTACHLQYPVYYDPIEDRLCDLDTVVRTLKLQVAAQTPPAGCDGEVFMGVRQWKRRNLLGFRPTLPRRPRFADTIQDAGRIAVAEQRHLWAWAAKTEPADLEALAEGGVSVGFVEDGFLRSVGLGATLTQASSLVFDRQGIYFDPSRPSDLEDVVATAAEGGADLSRAAALRERIVAAGVTKYNVGATTPVPAPTRRPVILVPGQVEDDASIQRGCGETRTNQALLRAARECNPDAWIIYKPHPDVEAKLRAGHVPKTEIEAHADWVPSDFSVNELLNSADEVWTLTSLMGFEALLRGKAVTCLGVPFYAGWGLTNDLGDVPQRRRARPGLDGLVWAALIAYPSYRDPKTGLACTPEQIVERLAEGKPFQQATVLSRLQGAFASQSWLWRR
ncbi:MAG: capsular polysaccharide biosynthesis protein [Pseudomonadota bacterium]